MSATNKLPVYPLPTAIVNVGAARINIRALTRTEAMAIRALGDDLAAIERLMISHGTDRPLEEVEAWYAASSSGLVDPLVDAIARLSGLGAPEEAAPPARPAGRKKAG